MTPSRRLLSLWLVVLTLPVVIPALLVGCQPVKPTLPATTVVNSGCASFARITVSEADAKVISIPLLTAIHAHNIAYRHLCGGVNKSTLAIER